MFKNKKILCIIPARKNSQGLKNKNIKEINGKPLIYWPIKAAKKCKIIDYTIVTTDSNKIKNLSKKYGANVPFIRPKRLAKNTSKIYDVIIHTLNYLSKKNLYFDYFILLEPTSPLTNHKDISSSTKKLLSNKIATSLVSVTPNITSHPIFNLKMKKNNLVKKYTQKKISIHRQNISKLYYISGNIYISKIDTYLKSKSFVQNKTIGYLVNKWKASEIDDIVVFIKTEAIIKYKKSK